ncbi:MAG: hypothetical protein ABIQ16_26250 [Polyangiaceae bacterium]
MPARRQRASAHVTVTAQPGLRLHAEGDRYSTLLKERERLLRSIGTKKSKLERARADSEEARSAVLSQLEPFVARCDAATAQLRGLFEQLLAPGRLSASAAKQVAAVRRSLAGLGFLGAPEDDESFERAGSEHDWEGSDPEAPDDYPPRGARPKDDPTQREVGSAPQHGQAKNQESLRTVFRRLVAASHPDRASDEADLERRTSAMKQATQAYEQGDLARLLQLEKAWQGGQSPPPGGSSEANCRVLERMIRELRAQSSQLQTELRAAQKSASLTPEAEPVVEAIEEAKADVEQLEALRDFVTRFRDGKMSLGEFVKGPQRQYVDPELEELLSALFNEGPPKAARQSKRRPATPKKRRGKG